MVRNILIAFCVILFVSCSKDTESKLFGKWQLQKVEASGNVQNVDTVYFNFEHSLFMYQVYVTEIDSFRHQYGYNTLEGEKTLLLELENNPGRSVNSCPIPIGILPNKPIQSINWNPSN